MNMDIWIRILQLLLSLSILVIVHEFGHFIAARVFRTRVEKFYLFFNPWLSLIKVTKQSNGNKLHLFSTNKDEKPEDFQGTEYGIGWLPLGGYVKIAGMIDESMDKEALKQDPQPYEFRSKPAWQRLIIMLGGVIFNIILAVLIYIGMLFFWGEQYLPTSEVKYGITVDSLGREMGLMPGDQIISVNGNPVEDFFKIPAAIIIDESKTIEVIRNGEPYQVNIPPDFLNKLIKHRSADFIGVRVPFEIAGFSEDSPAKIAGFLENDRIIGIDTVSIGYFDEFKSIISNYKGQSVRITAVREADTLSRMVNVAESGVIGVYTKSPVNFFKFREKKYGLLESIPAGIAKTYSGVENYLKQLKLIFSPEVKAYESVGGFITIGSIFPPEWDWRAFWSLTAFLSIMLAILNILPIPALDGGHVMFLMYEIIARRKPSDKFLEYAQIAGMVILFALLIFANGNDIIKLFNK